MKILFLPLLLSLHLVILDCWSLSFSKTSEPSKPAEQDKHKLVVFVSSKCPCSQSHLPELSDLYQEYQDTVDFELYVTEGSLKDKSWDRLGPELKSRLKLDHDLKVANRFKALKTPHVFLMQNKSKEESRDGQIKTLYRGAITNSMNLKRAKKKYLRQALQQVMGSTKVKIAQTKPIGCFIR